MIEGSDGAGAVDSLNQRLRQQADSEYGLFGLVQQLHMPFGVLFEAARNPAEKVAANLGHLGPGGIAALEFRSLDGSPGIATGADPEKIQRHIDPTCWAAPRPVEQTGP